MLKSESMKLELNIFELIENFQYKKIRENEKEKLKAKRVRA